MSTDVPTETASDVRVIAESHHIGAPIKAARWKGHLLVVGTNFSSLVGLDESSLVPVAVIDLPPAKLEDGSPAVNRIPTAVAVDGDVAYVAMEAGNAVGVARVEVATGAVQQRFVAVRSSFPSLCMNKDEIVVTAEPAHQLVVFDPDTLGTNRVVDVPEAPTAVACRNGRAYVGVRGAGHVYELEESDVRLQGTWEGGGTYALSAPDGSDELYASDPTARAIVRCRTDSWECSTKSLDGEVRDITTSANSVFAIRYSDASSVVVLDRATLGTARQIPIGGLLRGLIVL